MSVCFCGKFILVAYALFSLIFRFHRGLIDINEGNDMNTMQLILSPPSTKDINIKMSTQTDSPVNGEISQTYKINQETVAAIEKTLMNETKSPVSKNNVLEGENLDAKANGNKNCILENTIEEDDLIESIHSDVTNISNGTGCAQDTNEFECNTQNLDMTNADEVATKNTVNLKLSLPNNSKNSESLTEPESKSGLPNADEPLCENSKILLEEITETSASVSTNVPKCIVTNNEPNILIHEEVRDLALLLDDEDVIMQEVNGISTDENLILPETEDLNPTTVDEEVLSSIQTSKTVISTESLEPVEIEDECLSLQTCENLASMVAEDVSPIEIDEEVSSVVQTCEDVISLEANTLKSIKIVEVKLQSNVNSDQCTDAVKMTELETTSENIVAANIDQLKDSSDINCNNNQEADVFLGDSNNICEQNKAIDDEKNKDSDSMEIDDKVEKANVVKENLTEMSNNIDTTLNDMVGKDTIIEDTTKLEVISETAVEQKFSENMVLRRELESIKDKKESKESSKLNLEKEPTENILTAGSQENDVIPKAAVENSSVSGKIIVEEVIRDLTSEDQENIEIIDEDDVNIIDIDEEKTKIQSKEKSPERQETTTLPVVCKLSNTLDILSDDEEEASNEVANKPTESSTEEKQWINLDDDDDIMLIEEDSNSKDKTEVLKTKEEVEPKLRDKIDEETGEKHTTENLDLTPKVNEKGKLNCKLLKYQMILIDLN